MQKPNPLPLADAFKGDIKEILSPGVNLARILCV
jgi:hypothetical protein